MWCGFYPHHETDATSLLRGPSDASDVGGSAATMLRCQNEPSDFVTVALVLLGKDAGANPSIDRDALLAGDVHDLAHAQNLVSRRRGCTRFSEDLRDLTCVTLLRRFVDCVDSKG